MVDLDLPVDPRGEADLVHDVALGNLKRTLFGAAARTHIGRYEVRGILGVGGMGVVYRAHDPELDREVAIKVIASTPVPQRARAGRARLLREARALATLVHPNVLPIYDVGTPAPSDAQRLGVGDFYIVTELVVGESLGGWLERRDRSVAEILHVFAQAAHGLAAAHAIGFVHRDFKPSNVLIGDDGRVRVCDFGLVASSGSIDETTTRDDGLPRDLLWDGKLSRTDGVIGTPGYIAPEQFHGDSIGPRADQYAFCVALWAALYRRHPYFDDIGELDPSGRPLRAPPRRVDVAHRLHMAIERGLALDPAARWPSMQPLIELLEGRRRRGMALAIVGGAVAIGGATAVIVAMLDDPPPACDGAARVAAVWGAEQHATVAAAITDVATPYAADSSERVVQSLDAFADAWMFGYEEACVAVERDAIAAEARRRCYERRLDELTAMVDTLRATDPNTLRNSVAAATSLAAPATCDTPDRRDAWRPRDADEERRVVEIGRELASAEALLGAHRYRDAAAAAERAVELGRALPSSPHLFEAMNLSARARRELGLHGEAAEAYEAVYFEALAVPEETQALEAAIGRVSIARMQRDLDGGRRWAQHARALLPADAVGRRSALERQAGHLDVLAGDVHVGLETLRRALELAIEAEGQETATVTGCRALLADALRTVGRIDEAVELHRRVLASRTAQLGRGHPDVAEAHAELARGLLQAGDTTEAKAEIERALAIAEPDGETLGTASMLTTLASAHHELQEDALARAAFERALAIRRRFLEPDHPHVTSIVRSLGMLASDEGRLDEASALLGDALDAELRRLGPDHQSVGNLRYHLAFVERQRGEHERAVETMLESLRVLEVSLGVDHVDVARPLQVLSQWVSDDAEARRLGERAVAIVDRTQSDPVLRAYSYASLASALRREGRELGRADELHARALATCPSEHCRAEVTRRPR